VTPVAFGWASRKAAGPHVPHRSPQTDNGVVEKEENAVGQNLQNSLRGEGINELSVVQGATLLKQKRWTPEPGKQAEPTEKPPRHLRSPRSPLFTFYPPNNIPLSDALSKVKLQGKKPGLKFYLFTLY
jgi:hypothetical protein